MARAKHPSTFITAVEWRDGQYSFFYFSAPLFDHYEKDLKVNEKEMRCEQYFCTVLGKSHLGAKRDFEIWAFKVFSLDKKNTP